MEIREASAPMLENKMKEQIRRFEIEVFQADYESSDQNGNPVPKWKKVTYEQPIIIEASSKKDLDELQQNYAMCDQKFRIIRDLGPINGSSTDNSKLNTPVTKHANAINTADVQSAATQVSNVNQCVDTTIKVQQNLRKPKIINIGDIQLKYDGDKVYQKQWVKLTTNEQQQLRVVSDSNNKLVNLDGKHIEMKKWVLVEQSTLDDDSLNLD